MAGGRRRRVLATALGLPTVVTLVASTGLLALSLADGGQPGVAAHSTGHDAEWLGHAWVDGRKGQSDVDALVAQLRGRGIRDLFVHTGPYSDDGTLDPALRPRARWLIGALHTALPGVRVQAWLGAHPVPGQLRFDPTTRDALLTSVGQVLDDGFDGVHEDFEPVSDGDPDLLAVLGEAHTLTQRRHALLSVSAVHVEPWQHVAAGITALPGRLSIWSAGYLREVARRVDEVAVMAYDTALPSPTTYAGYVRRSTEVALATVPPGVTLLIGVPAYHDGNLLHNRRAETMDAAVRGVRLALGADPPDREFGLAIYVDFTITAADWAAYDQGWAHTEP
jgi:hypothetical protein